MIKFFTVASLLLFSTLALAPSAPSDTTETEIESPWTKSWILSLRGNQANYKDWSPGGVNSSALFYLLGSRQSILVVNSQTPYVLT